METKTRQRLWLQAWHTQLHWNDDLAKEQRLDLLLRFEGRLTRLFRRLGLTGMCRDCHAVFDPGELVQGPDGYECPVCRGTDLDGGGNPVNGPDPRDVRTDNYWASIHGDDNL